MNNMGIVAGYLLPHAKDIISDAESSDLIDIREKYLQIANEVREIDPDVIILISPHSEAYSDYFQIIDGDMSIITLDKGKPTERNMTIQYDKELIRKICSLSKNTLFPAGSEGNQDRTIDHGTLVPYFFIDKLDKKYKAVRCSVSGLSMAEHYKFGMIIQKSINELGRKAIVIASGDLSHSQDKLYDDMVLSDLSKSNFLNLLSYERSLLEKAKQCCHRTINIMLGCFDKRKIKTGIIDNREINNTNVAMIKFDVGEKDESRAFLSLYLKKERLEAAQRIQHEDEYVKLAHDAIEAYITHGKRIDVPDDLPDRMTSQASGVFVTIMKFGQLRGCIGTVVPQESNLAEEIISNAIASSSKDKRFPEISVDEFPYLYICVDVLDKPSIVSDLKELDPSKYGIILTKGNKKSALLPGMVGIDSVEKQIEIAKAKAMIGPNEQPVIEKFTIENH